MKRSVVAELRRLEHDVLTVADTGKANQRMSDAEVLEFAATIGLAPMER